MTKQHETLEIMYLITTVLMMVAVAFAVAEYEVLTVQTKMIDHWKSNAYDARQQVIESMGRNCNDIPQRKIPRLTETSI